MVWLDLKSHRQTTQIVKAIRHYKGIIMKSVLKQYFLPLTLAPLLTIFAISVAFAGPLVKLQTNVGDIVVELNEEKAPKSVANFLGYVNDGFYNGTIFHRVIDGFMIQGGGFTQDMQKKGTKAPIENEANNGLRNDRGTIAMARTNAPHSATAQFFINVVNNDFLNYRAPNSRGWGYAVFGKVVQGMDVVDKIRKIPTGPGGPFPKDVPQAPVVIENAMVVEAQPAQ
ncbi:peptidylprolyl isomerase [Kaarinaea lacus]